jgi:hypothetical protein
MRGVCNCPGLSGINCDLRFGTQLPGSKKRRLLFVSLSLSLFLFNFRPSCAGHVCLAAEQSQCARLVVSPHSRVCPRARPLAVFGCAVGNPSALQLSPAPRPRSARSQHGPGPHELGNGRIYRGSALSLPMLVPEREPREVAPPPLSGILSLSRVDALLRDMGMHSERLTLRPHIPRSAPNRTR